MRNQLAFIPDNISAISAKSIPPHPTSRNQPNDLNSDASAYLLEDILRPRTQKEGTQRERGDLIAVSSSVNKGKSDWRDFSQNNGPSEFRMKQSLKASRDRHSKFELLMGPNESIEQKPQFSELNDSGRKSEVSNKTEKNPQQTVNHPHIMDDKIQTLQNQSNQDYYMSREFQDSSNRMTQRGGLREQSEHRFVLTKVDRISNSQSNNISLDNSNFTDEKMLKNNTSIHAQHKLQSFQNSMEGHQGDDKEEKPQRSEINQSKKVEDLKKSYSNIDKKQERSKSSHSNQQGSKLQLNRMAREIQLIDDRDPSFGSMLQTPVKNLDGHRGFYQFVDKNNRDGDEGMDEQFKCIAKTITQRLNYKQTSEHNIEKVQSPLMSKKPSKIQTRNSIPRATNSVKQITSVKDNTAYINHQESRQDEYDFKYDTYQDQIDTQISDFTRDYKILEHRYQSNISYLHAQTKELESFYRWMVLEEQRIDLRRELIQGQIKNKREKIQLRNASYSKRFNFINPLPKSNDKPLKYIPVHPVNQEIVAYCKDLKLQIENEKKLHIENEAKINLLNKYYELVKSRKISDNQQFETEYQFDSRLGVFCPLKRRGSPDDSQCSIANIFQTPKKKLNKTKSQAGLGRTKTTAMNTATKKKDNLDRIERTPLTVYNLMKFKTEIQKDMLVEFQVHNMGREKRIKDETRLLKKQLEFVDSQIDHFDRSFAEEMKKFHQMSKPKDINYNSFKIQDKIDPYTLSPFNRDYHANNKGSNNINIYRPDNAFTSPSKADKSLSRNKYNIQRRSVHDLTLSKKQLDARSDKAIEGEDGSSTFFRKKAQNQLSKDEYGLITMGQPCLENTEAKNKISAIKLLKTSHSKKSLNFRQKSLARFKTQTLLSSEKSADSSGKLLRTSLTTRVLSPVSRRTQS